MSFRIVMTGADLEIHANLKTQFEADQIIRIIEFWKRLRWPLNIVTPTNIVRTDRQEEVK